VNNRKSRRAALIKELEAPVQPRQPLGSPEDDPSTPLALAVVRAGDARKAKQMTALRVGHLTSATDYFVNMEGTSKAQIDAIVKNIEDVVQEQFGISGKRQGKAVSGWVCLDFDSVVVNVFSQQERAFYQLEKFWSAAETLDLGDVLIAEPLPSGSISHDDSWGMEDGDDDWLLSDEEWSLDDITPETAGAPIGSGLGDGAMLGFGPATAEPVAQAGAMSAGDTAAEAGTGEAAELQIASEWADLAVELAAEARAEAEAEAAAEAKAAAAASAEAEAEAEMAVEDFALGDENLRRLVDNVESLLDEPLDEQKDSSDSWRQLMLEDGYSPDEMDDALDLADELTNGFLDDDDEW